MIVNERTKSAFQERSPEGHRVLRVKAAANRSTPEIRKRTAAASSGGTSRTEMPIASQVLPQIRQTAPYPRIALRVVEEGRGEFGIKDQFIGWLDVKTAQQ